MSDLIEFLRARLNEDEQAALGISDTWHVEDYEVTAQADGAVQASWVVAGPRGEVGVAMVNGVRRAHHIARHDPARVLREVEAKRRIIAEHEPGQDPCDAHDAMFETVPCDTLMELAAVYADHPDYREDWRVT